MNVKDLILKPIASRDANTFIKKHHYSGKVVNNSTLHFGVFYEDRLHGVMSLGSPLDKRKVLPLVKGTKWNEMLEFNRMAFDNFLPKYSESRCISVIIKLIRKNYSHIKWILSFADGTQCGDGTIYRASGFSLIGIKKNSDILEAEGFGVLHSFNLKASTKPNKKFQKLFAGKTLTRIKNEFGFVPLSGFQLRYIYLIDKTCEITVPILPFSKIDEMGAGMYKGKKRKCGSSTKRVRSSTRGKVAV